MGLFIWNDESWLFIENNIEYDTKDFVIARKLFIKWMNKHKDLFSTDEIKRELRLFGPIENIEIINESEHIIEAYVLFERSQSAFQAFMANRNGINSAPKLLQIQIADSWHQPDSFCLWNTIDPAKCSMLTINDDCLLEIFSYLDLDALVNMANVCTRFRNLLDKFVFPKVQMHTVFVFHVSLNLLRQTMKCIGPHLVHLCLRYQNHGIAPANYIEAEVEERATFKIFQNIGENLRKLTIRKPQKRKPSSNLLKLFVPALRQITFLEYDAEFDCDTIERLRQLCPCLQTLVLKQRIFKCVKSHDEVIDLRWPTLKSVQTFQYMAELDIKCQRFFERFIQSNPQLKFLKLTNVNDELFNVVTHHAQNLEYLEMLQNFDLCGIHSELTLHLLRNLKRLKVYVIRVKQTEFLNEVENQIRFLSEMKQLDLIVLLRNYSPPVWPPEHFPFAHYFSDIMIEANQMKLRIGDNSINIDFTSGKTTLVNIINSNNPMESGHHTLQREIQSLFDLSIRYFPECQQTVIFKNIDCYQHIHVSAASCE